MPLVLAQLLRSVWLAQWKFEKADCIRAPPRRGRYWEIHPRRPKGNLKGRGKSGGQRGWIFQYLPGFDGARTISQHQFFYREWIRKSFPVDREGLTVLKSILPCWWWQIVRFTWISTIQDYQEDWTKLAKDAVMGELPTLPMMLKLKLLKLLKPWKLYCTKKNWESTLCRIFDFSKGIDLKD